MVRLLRVGMRLKIMTTGFMIYDSSPFSLPLLKIMFFDGRPVGTCSFDLASH